MEKPTRRDVIKGLAAATIGSRLGTFIAEAKDKETQQEEENPPAPVDRPEPQVSELESEPAQAEDPEAFLHVQKMPVPINMRPFFAGEKLYDLLAAYSIGEERLVDPVEDIDFRFRLSELWRTKLRYVEKNDPKSYATILETAKSEFCSYDSEKKEAITLKEYMYEADTAVRDVRSGADFSRITTIPAFAKLGGAQIELLHRFEQKINGSTLIAYALTELMPTKKQMSAVGVRMLDFLLQHAGSEFVDRIPALHDSRISAGPYQFTPEAVDDNGAGRIQKAILKHEQIPTSLLSLHGAQQHKAAYLFAIDNLAMAVRQLGEPHAKKLLEYFSQLPDELVTELIATAHHIPAYARDALVTFTDALIVHNEHHAHDKKFPMPDFLEHCKTNGVGEYCLKTRDNIAALQQR